MRANLHLFNVETIRMEKFNCLCWNCPFFCFHNANTLTRWVSWPTVSPRKVSVLEDKFAEKNQTHATGIEHHFFHHRVWRNNWTIVFHDMVALSQENVSWRCDMFDVWSGYFLRCANQISKIKPDLNVTSFFPCGGNDGLARYLYSSLFIFIIVCRCFSQQHV